MAEEKSKQSDKPDEIIRDAEILVFDYCSSVDVKVRPECGIEVVYTLSHDLKEGRIQVFDGLGLKIDAEYPLPDLAAGKHLTTLPKTFYWRGEDWEDSLPDSMLLFTLGISPVNQMVGTLWAESDESDSSPYDYKPEPCTKYESEICDEGAMFRGDEVGITSLYIPGNRNLKLRVSGELPELEILGVGFVEGDEVEFGRGINPRRFFKAPLRDVRVVSTVSRDANSDIPVLKAGRFTVPKEIFEYPSHIRIVGKLK